MKHTYRHRYDADNETSILILILKNDIIQYNHKWLTFNNTGLKSVWNQFIMPILRVALNMIFIILVVANTGKKSMLNK
jgi:uncharacterized membrane protein (UPF0182 family)